MANSNSPQGLLPTRYVDGAMYNGACRAYYVPSTVTHNIFIGDPVLVTGGGDANGVPSLDLAVAGATNYITGAMVGIVSDGGYPGTGAVIGVTRDQPIYHPANTAQYILVADDPTLLFAVQEDSVGGAITAAVGPSSNVNLQAGAGGSTVTGYSSWMLVSAGAAAGNPTYQMRILQGLQEIDNLIGSAYAVWLCKINLHSQLNASGV